ncbi:DUF6461 domain-containing protein [Lentzea flava]|uniref:Uncharacterized protein n=1 Tax=Lentzea flava TaxID=103732 RepID=A0ABQ2UJQ0_9PSEU|nr:DUF6461 domain-containing protein [Lentzea flava]MCP2200301.1 hypothetical protein [Lentzea flava]GGU41354.1 hypothetical protein GCM10010178_37420 [Lentzea flava]
MKHVVDHYFELLSADVLPSDSFCLTAVRGLTVDEALERFDGYPGWDVCDLAEVGQRAAAVYPDELFTVIADQVDGWVLLAENNGWHGAKTSVLQRLSAGTVVASAFWNVNLDSTISLARDGEVLAAFDFVIDKEPPEVLLPHLEGLTFTDPYRMTAEALAFVEGVSGVRLTAEWATGRHPASVIADLWRFRQSDPVGWLDINAPEVRAALNVLDAESVRAAAEVVVARACEGVETADTSLPEAYHRVLELRWERSTPPDPAMDPIAQLNASVVRRNTVPVAERTAEARAHAIAANLALQEEDPAVALASAMYNFCQADRARWPALVTEVRAHLS